jgi:hypothetical protein
MVPGLLGRVGPELSTVTAERTIALKCGDPSPWQDLGPRHTLAGMIDQTYLVRLKPQSGAIQHVAASIVGVLGGHLVFLDAERRIAAVFLLDLVESWEVLPDSDRRP